MKNVILGGTEVGALANLTFPDATVYESKPQHKVRKKNFYYYYGRTYLTSPIAGLRAEQTRIITHIDGRNPTEESHVRYADKVGNPGKLIAYH